MQKTKIFTASVLSAAVTLGCQFHARAPEDYAAETKTLLNTKKDDIKACYDKLLEKDRKLAGVVAVEFTVEASTGAIKDAKLDADKTTASEELGQCVLSVMDGLKLDPPDARDGQASFTYDFSPKG